MHEDDAYTSGILFSLQIRCIRVVVVTLFSYHNSGSNIDARTSAIAARCTTKSAPSNSKFAISRLLCRSHSRTSCPSLISLFTNHLPMNPLDPVTDTIILILFSLMCSNYLVLVFCSLSGLSLFLCESLQIFLYLLGNYNDTT